MPDTLLKPARHTSARLQGARRLLTLALVLSTVVVAAVAADLWLRAADRNRPDQAWMQILTLSAPALWPAGTARRHPETMHPGVDLRFTPGLVRGP